MSSATPDSVPLEITVEETRDLLAARPGDTALIDVREPFEYDLSHIDGSTFIPMRRIPEHLDSDELPREKHLLIHCHHGGRSLRVTEWLRAQGYPRVTNVAGGIQAWSERVDSTVPRY